MSAAAWATLGAMERGAQWLRMIDELGSLSIEACDDGSVEHRDVVVRDVFNGIGPCFLVLVHDPVMNDATPFVDRDFDVILFGYRICDSDISVRGMCRQCAQGVVKPGR